jgi:peptidylprolyl isomerase
MFNRPAAILASLLLASAAIAQPATKPEEKPAQAPKTTPAPAAAPAVQPATPAAAQPTGDQMYEAPDGTKMSVVQKSRITLNIEIEDLKLGTGSECPAGASVTINYHGMLLDGSVFDTTRGEKPATFPLPRLIPGWQMGIPGMKVGGVRRLTIPYQLAYGEREIPGPDGKPLIPAKSNLVFSIEMLAINGKDAEGNAYPPKEKALSHVQTESGLIIEELRLGTGAECPKGATVVCQYKGTLAADGTTFDSTYDRNQQPATFSLNEVIKGWQEGIPGMKVGGKRRLIVPSELGYGAAGNRGIPPNAMLEFEVELLEVKN